MESLHIYTMKQNISGDEKKILFGGREAAVSE